MAKGKDNKADMLGMPIGTASGRLRKGLMLSLLRKLGDDKCFRCGCAIESAEELSIDHKLPWLNVSADLFWDVENVAFSHRACNKTDRPKYPKKHVGLDPGTAFCSKCKTPRAIDEFGIDKRTHLGVTSWCKECRSFHGTHASRK